MVSFRAGAVAETDPTLTYPAVPASVDKALKKVGITIDRVDLMEIQEAFAVQALADARMMGIKKENIDHRVNANGSGISLGHPVAATGAMRMVTLIHEMKRQSARFGLETICGGRASASARSLRGCLNGNRFTPFIDMNDEFHPFARIRSKEKIDGCEAIRPY